MPFRTFPVLYVQMAHTVLLARLTPFHALLARFSLSWALLRRQIASLVSLDMFAQRLALIILLKAVVLEVFVR
jgi:hypothetical protein